MSHELQSRDNLNPFSDGSENRLNFGESEHRLSACCQCASMSGLLSSSQKSEKRTGGRAGQGDSLAQGGRGGLQVSFRFWRPLGLHLFLGLPPLSTKWHHGVGSLRCLVFTNVRIVGVGVVRSAQATTLSVTDVALTVATIGG